ncbi:MAG: uracil-DNA glycosylase family protein [Planctomycetota bacterium]|nr:uracil-DNA glycosylase family protein [Planctomycetota bacterium]
MTREGLADLEADYRKIVSSICGIPSSPQVCFGRGGANPRVVFVLGLPNGVHPLDAEGEEKFTQLRTAMQLESDEVYITTVIKTLTLASRAPHPADVRRDRPWLERQLSQLAPQAIVAFGPKVGAMLTSGEIQECGAGQISSLELDEDHGSFAVHMTHEFSVLTRQGRDEAKAREMWSHLQAVMKAIAS